MFDANPPHVQETVIHERVPLAKGAAKLLMPIKKSHSYVIRRHDGEEFSADVNNLADVGFLAAALRTEAQQRGTPWEIQELRT